MGHNSDFLTVDELAIQLRVASVTVRLWTRDGRIPVHRFGKLLRYRLAEVVQAFEGCSAQTA